MEALKFKSIFGNVAKTHGFSTAYGGWHQETQSALVVLDIQKSNFGNYFELNVKIFLNTRVPTSPSELKKLVKSLSGDIFRRQPEEYRVAFDLDAPVTNFDREELINMLFTNFVDRIVLASSNPADLLRLRDEGVIYLLPMVEARLKP